MKVLAIKKNIHLEQNELKKFIDELGPLEKLNEYSGKADFIVNCLPTIPNVKVIYTEEVFNAMK